MSKQHRLNVTRGLYCTQENLDEVLIDIPGVSGANQICYSHDLSKNDEEDEYKANIEMIFEVERTSQWDFDENKPPCDGAFIKEFEIIETKWNKPNAKKKLKRWFIELETLEDLLAFKEEIDEELIIRNSNWRDDIKDVTVNYQIEIYDTCRYI